MLIKGSTPTKEPLVSIGLILPVDKQKYVKITSKSNLDYEIEALENQLLVNGKKSNQFKLQQSAKESNLKIDPVTAGRGFHWQKQDYQKLIKLVELIFSFDSYISVFIIHYFRRFAIVTIVTFASFLNI